MAQSVDDYETLRAKIWEGDTLYEDREFPAVADSIDPVVPTSADWRWKRPREIAAKPMFISDGTSRLDLCQGELGDCWFVCAASSLAMKRTLLAKVVPLDQTFSIDKYAGIFHFYFWRFGEWKEVIIDDLLPVTSENKLRFCHNREDTSEFWPALLEKAYAKLHGSYDALRGGHIRDAMVDFTGGLSETYNLRKEEEIPDDLFEIMKKSVGMNSQIGCYIWGEAGDTQEEKLWNGLYRGHAYNVTKVMQTRVGGWQVKLVRLRNPWGEGEWTGAWGDNSEEWKSLGEEERKKLGLVKEEDGEFWMSFKDLLSHFHALDIVHLGPEPFARLPEQEKADAERKDQCLWHEVVHHGTWVKGINAGGSGLLSGDKNLYYSNPQYHFTLRRPDTEDVGEDCTCVISLMQKQYRSRKMNPFQRNIVIGFDVHSLKDNVPNAIDGKGGPEVEKYLLKKQFRTRTPFREISCRLQLPPGLYCLIPSTLRPNQDAQFLVRIYTYERCKSGTLTEEETGPSPSTKDKDQPNGNIQEEVFKVYAEEENVIDARDLRDMLNAVFRKELKENTNFSMEVSRSLIAMYDHEASGVLDHEEVNKLWQSLLFWRKLFKEYDKDKSGFVDTVELRNVFKRIGFTLSLNTLAKLVVRYGGKERAISFEDFVLCISRAQTMYKVFRRHSADNHEVKMNLEQWMLTTLYY